MANDRMTKHGVDPNEIKKRSAIITTAGVKNSFAYNLQMEFLKDMLDGKSAFVLGAGYELATGFGLLSIDYINELKESDSFNVSSFLREYGSEWSGSSEDSLVDLETFRKSRVVKVAEDKHSGEKDVEYVLSIDVARNEGSSTANSALVIIKLIPRGDGTYRKNVVNIYTFNGTHFLEQAKFLKKKVNDFKARMLVIDANGLGVGLVDQLVLEIDENPAYSVVNDDRYNKFKTPESIPMVYTIRSNSKEQKASDIHNLFIRLIQGNHVKFLVSESQAKQEVPKKMQDKMSDYLRPYIMTDLLQDEIMNLEYRQSGNQTQVKQVSKQIQKDRFSALEYGLHYIDTIEKKNLSNKNKSIDVSNFLITRQSNLRMR